MDEKTVREFISLVERARAAVQAGDDAAAVDLLNEIAVRFGRMLPPIRATLHVPLDATVIGR